MVRTIRENNGLTVKFFWIKPKTEIKNKNNHILQMEVR